MPLCFTKSLFPLHLHVSPMFFLLDLFAESVDVKAHHSKPGIIDPSLACCLRGPPPLHSLLRGLVFRQIHVVHCLNLDWWKERHPTASRIFARNRLFLINCETEDRVDPSFLIIYIFLKFRQWPVLTSAWMRMKPLLLCLERPLVTMVTFATANTVVYLAQITAVNLPLA